MNFLLFKSSADCCFLIIRDGEKEGSITTENRAEILFMESIVECEQ